MPIASFELKLDVPGVDTLGQKRLNQKQDINIDFSKARVIAHTSNYNASKLKEFFEISTQLKNTFNDVLPCIISKI